MIIDGKAHNRDVYKNNIEGEIFITIEWDKVKSLAESYNYDFSAKELCMLESAENQDKEIESSLFIDVLELAELCIFLRICKTNPIQLNSAAASNKLGKVKGSVQKITLNSIGLIEALEVSINTLLRVEAEWSYESIFNRSVSIQYDPHIPKEGEIYTEEELNQIISYCKRQRNEISLKGNAAKGRRLYFVYHKLKDAGYFGQSKQKEYSFLYDWYVLAGIANDIGEGYSGSIGKEKYQQIKNWITAYKKFKGSLKG